MQNEYIDLPIILQETPKNMLDKAPAYKVPQKPQDAANQILKTLETLLKAPSNEIYVFYQTALPATYKAHFIDKEWPSTDTLEQQNDTQYKPGAKTIYKQFALRTSWNKVKNIKDADKYCDIIDEAWEEYTSIFELELTKINFPAQMIWDYFDGFLEIYLFHQHKVASVSNSSNFKAENFGAESSKKMFKKLYSLIPTNFNQNCTSRELFSYYSAVALAAISVNEGNYKQALSYVSKISLKQIVLFSKGLGSLLTLFFTAAFSYFMLQEFHKSVKICEIVVTFYQKYRKFFDKSFSYFSQLQPMYEKLVILQCINYIFLQEKPKTAVLQIFKNTNVKTKERQARDKISDCFFKMKQNDITTFWRLFSFLTTDFNIPNMQQNITESFKKLQSVNINTIIQNYRRIQLQKISKMLGIPIEQIRRKFKSLGAVQKTESAWDSTIINPLLRQKKKVNVMIEENIAIFDSQNVDTEEYAREWNRYREELSWLSEKAKAI